MKRKESQVANKTTRTVFDVPDALHARLVDVCIATGFDKNAIMAAGLRLVVARFEVKRNCLAWDAFFGEERTVQGSEGANLKEPEETDMTRGRSRSLEVRELPL